MTHENFHPQSPEELAKAAQEAAVKAAMEQAQAMFGGIPGFQMPDMAAMQEQISAQMQAAVPNLEEIQAQQAAMGTLGGISTDRIAQAGQANMGLVAQMMQTLMDIDEEEEDLWLIERADDGQLSPHRLHLLAFGAPLFVYNSEQVDSTGSIYDVSVTRSQMLDWWGIQNHDTAFDTVRWLLEEGHHATADRILHLLRTEGTEALQRAAEEDDELAEKMDEVLPILQLMPRLGYTDDELPVTSIGWDLVRVTNVARWTRQCGYISEEEMWQVMELVERIARQHFSSWREYALSYVLGRGVWRGEQQDCLTAHEIAETLLLKEESPWRQCEW